MEEERSTDVAVYVVWSSQVGAKEKHVPGAAELMEDRRAVHFWDPDQRVGKAYQPILGTPAAAWDVWMLFDRGERWTGAAPPRPTWWEHQLRQLPSERFLDPERFAQKAQNLVRRKAAALAAPSIYWGRFAAWIAVLRRPRFASGLG